MTEYQPREIEKKWQQQWQATGLYLAEDFSDKPKRYILVEFPYPSGEGLHVGHCLSYVAQDMVARYARMKGYNVLFPMGWDAFGLPAENFAIKHKIHPREAVEQNVANFKRQIQSLGISFDWTREVNTTDPKFYRWTQWIFLQLFKAGLAEKKQVAINWCPKDKIGLAFEEVVDGKCERCGTEVEQRSINQWVLKITKYADRLIDDLETVDYLPHIKKQQIDWIGRSEGAEVQFKLADSDDVITVFTTRLDTIFSGAFVILAPEHPIIKKLELRIKNSGEVQDYIEASKKLTDRERQENQEITGVELQGIQVINPATGTALPVWVANFVLAQYGTGGVFADAHDQRDFDLAKAHHIPLTVSIKPTDESLWPSIEKLETCYEGEGTLVNSKQFDGMTSAEARVKILAWLQQQGLAQGKVNYKLRDWIFSRQHYWGEPIPMTHCDHCKEVVESTPHQLNFREEKIWKKIISGEKTIETRALNPEEPERYFGNIKEGDLVKFTYVPTGENLYFKIKAAHIYNDLKALAQDQALLAKIGLKKQYQSEVELLADYNFTDDYADRIKKNGLVAWEIKRIYPGIIPLRPEQLPLELPEVDHYEPTDTGESPLASMTDWVNITCRVCGHPAKRETDTMPNWAGSSWYFLRYTDAQNDQVFADRKKLDYWLPVDLYNGGMEHTTLHLLYSRFWHKFLFDQKLVPTAEPYTRRISHGMILGPDSQKMSKSRGNVINPDAIVEKFGADTLRLYEMFMGEYDGTKIWNDSSVQGIHRFLKRIWNYSQTVTVDDSSDDSLEVIVQTSIKKITEDIERRSFNTVISQLMILFNALEEHTSVAKKYLTIFLQLLAPIAPHISEEIWQTTLGEKDSIHQQAWPMADESLLQSQKLIIPVQIAGKVRTHIEVQPDITEEEIKQQVLVLPQVMKYLDGAAPKKFIYVKGKIVNIVI